MNVLRERRREACVSFVFVALLEETSSVVNDSVHVRIKLQVLKIYFTQIVIKNDNISELFVYFIQYKTVVESVICYRHDELQYLIIV